MIIKMTYAPQKQYKAPHLDYIVAESLRKEDFTNLVPNKRMEMVKLPAGFYGYTFLGQNYMAINDNLPPARSHETQVHEAIHTPDEYETRVLTWWKISSDKKAYQIDLTDKLKDNH